MVKHTSVVVHEEMAVLFCTQDLLGNPKGRNHMV